MLTEQERLVLIEHMAKIAEKDDSKRVEIDFHDWAWLMELAEEALNK